MDFSCNKNCITQWGCSWCRNKHCDDTCCPYRLEGKPTYWTEQSACKNPFFKAKWITLTEKEKNKIRKKYETPENTVFYLCNTCKDKYVEQNVCKGRHLDKIGKKGYYW